MRVYEIAKEVGMGAKDLLAKIRALGLEVNNHMSSLDADDVARIRRSLEKEKTTVAPAQTQKLSTGTVLRRRSSGERPSDDAKPASTPPAPPVAPAPPPMIRRRVEAAPPVVETKPVEPEREVREAREERDARPRVRESVARPAAPPPVVEAPKPAPVAVEPPPVAPARRVVEAAPVVEHRAVEERPAPVEARPVEARPVEVAPPPVAPPPVARPAPQPAPVAAAAAEAAPAAPRSRVIVAGPQVVARSHGHDQQQQHHQARPVAPEPPPSTPLPPRITPVRHAVEHRADAEQKHVEGTLPPTARSQFEMELERARARTADKPRIVEVEIKQPTNGDVQPAAQAPRDPSRPAVGTVIALPPRIKITERTPIGGRPAPGPQPVNPIRGRYAQQQQQRGRPGQGRPGGPHDMRKKLPLGKKGKQTIITTPAEHKRVIRIEDTIAIADLARNMGIKAPEVLKKLWGMGMTGVNINASIDFDTAQILASEFGYEVQNVAFNEEDAFAQPSETDGELEPRSPVVTVMGHVDHGKTSLLDAIRKTRVAAGEAGGITQHVAAYKVPVDGHGEIVFLDTPGHEAFSEMRARGAQATDIVVLVVAANDGVMPQTLEALSHAKDANVRIIVAVNKIDLPDAQPERVKQQLADKSLIPEEWGGDTIYVNVSALKGENIDKLLESIALTAEVMELKADPKKPAQGLVIEARLDRNRGPMATVLVQEGTLRVGDILVAGRTFGKVRAMLDDTGQSIEEAGPSTPIEVLGLDGVPDAGDQVNAAEDDKVAKQVVDFRRQSFRRRELASTGRVSLENLMARISEGVDQKELKVVLKADVQGSAEALKAALVKLSTEKVKVTVIAAAVGGITESDVNLAKAGNAIIVGFHVRPAGKSSKLAEQEGVEIRLYDIIYDALDEVKAAMAGLLAPIKREVAMGKLNVRETFSIPKMGTVAGCMVTEGKINRKAHLRIIRDAVQVYEGKIGSLRRFKDDVSEVQHGFECGVMVAGWNEVKQGDIIEAYEVIEEAAQL
ncbi:MAG TPA: translation initiation factor IF-2 [Kofleriaceae bacterium]|jgi:translation initiation factor IF-2